MNRFGVIFVVLLCWCGAPAAQGAASKGDLVASLSRNPPIASMVIAPGGRHLAGVSHHDNSLASVFITEVATMRSRQLVPTYPGSGRVNRPGALVSPSWVVWLNTDLIVVGFSDGTTQSFNIDNPRPLYDLGGGYIRRDGQLTDNAGTDWVLARGETGDSDVIRMNARTGKKERFWVPLPGSLVDCVFDAQGNLRAVTMSDTAFWSDRTTLSHWYRASPKGEWQLVAESPQAEMSWTPLFVPDEPDRIIVGGRFDGRDTQAIYLFDTKAKRPVELLAGHDREDLEYVQGLSLPSFIGVSTGGMKPRAIWFDDRWAGLQKAIDAALPGSTNTLSGDKHGRMLVHSRSDTDPGRWFLLETQTMALREIASAYPDLKPSDMAPMQVIEYASPDGMRIPAYLTRPLRATGPVPLVVVIHGGPHARDHWQWDHEVQLLAGRGYAVLQPQFRGSSGFGRKFLEAGYGQWGLGMQDDISAGVRHLIREGIVDASRVCIYGTSYGGYAALWGLAATPELYRCGVSLAGVSDIERMLTESSQRNRRAATRDLLRHRVGDRSLNRQQFAEVSPLRHAHRIRVPVLLAHGDEDDVVPISHSERMVDALRAHGKTVEWLKLDDPGHGLFTVGGQQDFLRAMLRFLDTHLGSLAAPMAEAPGR